MPKATAKPAKKTAAKRDSKAKRNSKASSTKQLPAGHSAATYSNGQEFGRPMDYDPKFVPIVEAMCKLGATDAEVADALDVTTTTLWRWRSRYKDFCEAMKGGKEQFDDRVERSLAQKAVGYTYDSVKVFMPAGTSEPVYAPIKEHVPPDVAAIRMWLHNRRSHVWRESVRNEITGPDGGPLQIEAVEPLERGRRIAFLLTQATQQQLEDKSE